MYRNDTLQFMATAEGRTRISSGTYVFDYFLKDHLGNVRMTVTDDYTAARPVLDATSYYPFGLIMAGISSKAAGSLENKRKYNSIELDEDLGIEEYEAFYRSLDPQTGRWWQIDPKIEDDQESLSPYASMANDPIKLSDPLGDEPDDDDGCPACKSLVNMVVEVSYAVKGAAAAVIDNTTGVNFRKTWAPDGGTGNVQAYNRGQDVGDAGSVVLGAVETVTGGTAAGGGTVATVGTGGIASPVSVPVAAAGVAMTAHGLMTGVNGARNLVEQKDRAQNTSNSARREVMRREGIPTSQQPVSQKKTSAGREYVYDRPKPGGGTQKNHVQQQLKDKNHGPHWEAGSPKKNGQTDPSGRQRLQNNKSKVDYNE